MNRRGYLRVVGGSAGTLVLTGASGCLGDGASGGEAANEFGYDTYTNEEVPVPLVPVADAGDWFDDDEVVFVDARTRNAYDDARIAGAVFSPARHGLSEDDPVDALDTDTRFVTYCVCPHELATLRAESMISDGYRHTYALDEGLQGWVDAGLPVEGEEVNNLHLDDPYHTS